MMMLLLALAAPAQTRTVTWPDGWFSIEVPAEWSWYEEKEFETGVQKAVLPFERVADMSLAQDAIKLAG